MSYDAERLFGLKELNSECILTRYLKKTDPAIKEIEIPAEHNGKPVTIINRFAFREAAYLEKVMFPEGVRRIDEGAFYYCKNLRSVSFPASLEEIGERAFGNCGELCEAEFRSSPSFNPSAFSDDLKLPAELLLMCVLNSRDLTTAFSNAKLDTEILWLNIAPLSSWLLLRPDVFALALKNGCFRLIDAGSWFRLFECFVENNCAEQLRLAENYAELTAEQLGVLIKYSAGLGKTEITAYLLELKKRKFGFNGGDNFEL